MAIKIGKPIVKGTLNTIKVIICKKPIRNKAANQIISSIL